jgi:predicted NBD/HSP70 family sugar kinase/putative N-acetylmannosamine-6-phosphate epimerase
MNHHDLLPGLRGRLVVSCQAPDGDPFRDSESMARFARAARDGGAAGIRANGAPDVAAIRAAVDLPIIGIAKKLWSDGRILITGDFDEAAAVVAAGADIIAIDCTARGQRFGALDRMARIQAELGVSVFADIATVEEAVVAARAGADAVLSTMRGYTDETAQVTRFEPDFIAALTRAVKVPVIAEGHIQDPEEVRAALAAGAWSVIIGTAITRPGEITRRFASAIAAPEGDVLGIDLGGTNTKFGIVTASGKLVAEGAVPTPPGGRQVLLDHLKSVTTTLRGRPGFKPRALGIATAGWVDPYRGEVAYATENLPGWTGTRIAEELRPVAGVPVFVENDANALAAAEAQYGTARGVSDFICITLGTGVGGGCYVGGRLNRGAHFFANGLGHIPIQPDGRPCTCGLKGCFEVYANAQALVRYAEGAFTAADQVIAAAREGNPKARAALRTYAKYLATGAASIVQLLDPELLVLAGGVAQDNPFLLPDLESELVSRITVPTQRRLSLRISELGYYAGVYGAAAITR